MSELQTQDGQKVLHTELLESSIVCIGDPIIDLYVQENGEVRVFKGGALNVFENLAALNPSSLFIDPVYNRIVTSSESKEFYDYAFDSQGSKHYSKVLFLPSKELIKLRNASYNYSIGDYSFLRNKQLKTLVLSDYNRGVLNNFSWATGSHLFRIKLEADLLVVDSKRRTLNLDLVKSKRKIWHATGGEFDFTWSSHFDYTIRTNASSPVEIISSKNNKTIYKIPVPNTKIVNTIGAGDTFVAAIAAFLHDQEASNEKQFLSLLEQAVRFGIKCCQDVIQQPYTSVTKIKLR